MSSVDCTFHDPFFHIQVFCLLSVIASFTHFTIECFSLLNLIVSIITYFDNLVFSLLNLRFLFSIIHLIIECFLFLVWLFCITHFNSFELACDTQTNTGDITKRSRTILV